MYDLHSHILPAIDDGAKSIEDSVELCRMAAADGVEAIVATPHIREGVWPNERSRIEPLVEELREELARQEIALEVAIGAEVYFGTEIAHGVREGAFPTYADGNRYFLLELPNYFVARQVQNVVFDFRTAGLTPVLAHPERNPQLMAHLDLLEDLVRQGTLLQITAMSITGRFGRGARKAADTLLGRGLAHVVASDAHHARYRPALLRDAYDRIAQSHGPEIAEMLFVENPRRIVRGEDVEGGVWARPEATGGLRGLIARVFGAT